jgi:hypothetical protein
MTLNTANIFFQYDSGGVLVSVLVSSALDRGFEPGSGQTKDYAICICCFSARHASLRKSKDWLARNQDNLCEWCDMSFRRLLLQWASTMKKQRLTSLLSVNDHSLLHCVLYILFIIQPFAWFPDLVVLHLDKMGARENYLSSDQKKISL